MKVSLYKMLLGCIAVFGFAAVGCDDQVTMSDVDAAREEVREEAQDVQEAQREASEEVAEEQDDVNEVVREENKEIAEERADLAEAQREAAEVEQEFVNQEQRKAYIDQHRAALDDFEGRIDALETDAAKIEDEAQREARETELTNLRNVYDDANDKFGELDATDEENWRSEHTAFAGAFQRLQAEMSKVGTATVIDPAVPATDAPLVP